MARADKFTLEGKKREIYSDFLNNFDMNPYTGMLARVTNEDSVKQSLKNLILTNCGERFYNSNKGSKIRASLFELYDQGLFDIMKLQLAQTCAFWEPRAIIQKINVNPGFDSNEYAVTIVFSIINIPDRQFSLDLNVKRVR